MVSHPNPLWAPPVFAGDEAKTRSAQTLHRLLLSYLAVAGLACLLAFFIFASKAAGLALALVFLAPMLAAFGVMRRGQIRAASVITVAGSWLIVTFYVSLSGGMTSTAVVFYLVCTTFAGLLLGDRAAVVVACLSGLAGLGLALVSAAGYALPRLFPMPPQSGWLVMTFSLYLVTVTLNIALKDIRQALASAQQQLARRQTAEEALRESQQRYLTLFENAHDALYVMDKHVYLECNQKAVDIFGCRDKGGLVGHSPLDFSPVHQPDGQASAAKADGYIQAAMAGTPQFFYWQHQRPDRTLIDTEVSLNVLTLQGKTCLQAIVRDITARRQAEARLKQSEEKYRSIFENAAEGIFQSTPAGRFLSVNPAAVKLFGYSAEELISHITDIGQQIYAHPEDREKLLQRLALSGSVENYELECRRRDGQSIWLSLNLHAVPAAGDTGLYYEGAFLDITARRQMEQRLIALVNELSDTVAQLKAEIAERLQAEANLRQSEENYRQLNAELEQHVTDRTQQLNQTNAELARAVRARDEFLTTMSHELRSPLNTILITTEALAEGVYGELGASHHFPLRSITESGQHLLALINDILDLAKFEAGKVELALVSVKVEEICQAALRLIREPALKKQLRLTTQFDPQARVLQADERRLKQILVNLLTNAVKFTPEGGEVGLIVHGEALAQTLSFTVWDTGVGIAADDLVRLFKPFVQVDNRLARAHTGTGLGLALVKNMVELHGGSVSVESAVGRGSRFTISLPWSRPPAAADQVAPSLVTAPLRVGLGQGQQLLLADDSELAIPPMVAYLQACGYRLAVARNGQEALNLALEKHPALILMDIQMPQMDGLEAMRQLRARPEMARVPIIALTALAMPGDRERCLAAGANDYLSKPANLPTLLSKINALVA